MVWRYRNDGDLVTEVPATRRIMPFIMPTRNESLVFFDLELDAELVDKKVAALRDQGVPASILHVLTIAAVRILHERPRLNRFVAGGRHWQRRGIWISFSGKKRKDDDSPIVALKRHLSPDDDDATIARALDGGVREVRADQKNHTDKELDILLSLPTFLLALLVWCVRRADHWGLLPRFFVDGDPLFSSIFIANLGSLKMNAPQHHLYEYGNIPLFCAVGQKKPALIAKDDGSIATRQVYPLRFTFDERVEDGLYCLGALKRLQALVEAAPDAAATAATASAPTRG